MSIYDEMQGVASEIFEEFQQGTVRYKKLVPGDGPVDNPGVPTIQYTLLNAAVRGAQFKYVTTGLAQKTDLQVSCAVVDGLMVAIDDFIEIDGIDYKITQFIPKPSAGNPAAWLFIVSKGA